jgi:hypothetical protein
MTLTTNITFQLRRDTTTNWTTYNPVLQAGEIGIDTVLNKFKIGNGSSVWSALSYGSILASELTAAITSHNSTTTNVHGIADTAALATKTYSDSAVSTAIASEVTARNSAVSTAKSEAITTASSDATSKVSTHNSATTNIHGIADTAALATKTYVDTAVTSLGNTASTTYALQSDVGNADGIATLDTDGRVPLSQLGNLIDGAPTALNTLNELAAALGNNASFSTTITNSLGTTNTNVTNLTGSLSTTNTNVSNLTSSLGTTNTNVSNLTTSVNSLTSTVNQFDARIVSLELGLGI